MECSPANPDAAVFGRIHDVVVLLKRIDQGYLGSLALSTLLSAFLQAHTQHACRNLLLEVYGRAKLCDARHGCSVSLTATFNVQRAKRAAKIIKLYYLEVQMVGLAFERLAIDAVSGPVHFLALFGAVADL